MLEKRMTDIAIIGTGVGGLGAGLYAGRYELSTIIIGNMLGGATSTAWTVENYPGFDSIDGYDLVVKMKEQVEKLGVQFLTDRVTAITKKADHFALETATNQTVEAKTIVLAMGAARRELKLPKEAEFSQGKGVHYCTTCDGPLYKGKTIGIVGGGDSAVKGMNLAVQYAEKIYVFVREDELKAEPINYHRIKQYLGNKIEPIFNVEIKELLGENRLSGVKLSNGQEITLDGLFVEIGAIPEVDIATKLGVKLDKYGYILVNAAMETNVPGIYAAGDTTNFFGHFKQILTAAAMGSVASTSAFKYIEDHKS